MLLGCLWRGMLFGVLLNPGNQLTHQAGVFAVASRGYCQLDTAARYSSACPLLQLSLSLSHLDPAHFVAALRIWSGTEGTDMLPLAQS